MEDKLFEALSEFKDVRRKRLIASLVITLIFMVVELIGGYLVNSIALINDGGHMFTHAFSITIALIGIRISKEPKCEHKTYGLYRAEILAAFVNGLFLLAVVGFLIIEAVERILNPVTIDSIYMFIVAILGLIVNISSILILHGTGNGHEHHGNEQDHHDQQHNEDLNVQGVVSHMLADTISSVGVVIVAVIIHFTSWTFLDPLVSIGIAAIIISWSLKILKQSGRILLQIAPEGMDSNMIREDLLDRFNSIKNIFHMHFWTITSQVNVVSFHMILKNINIAEKIALIDSINDYLYQKYHVIDSTIQIEYDDNGNYCRL